MADSPYTGTARGRQTDDGKPGRLQDPPSKGGIMNMTTPTSGGAPYKSTSPYAGTARGTECQDVNDADDSDGGSDD